MYYLFSKLYPSFYDPVGRPKVANEMIENTHFHFQAGLQIHNFEFFTEFMLEKTL